MNFEHVETAPTPDLGNIPKAAVRFDDDPWLTWLPCFIVGLGPTRYVVQDTDGQITALHVDKVDLFVIDETYVAGWLGGEWQTARGESVEGVVYVG